MAIRNELILHLQNSPGELARVCSTLSDEHVNIVALSLEAGGILRLVVDNHVRAAGALRGGQAQVEERDVLYIQVPNAPGAFAGVTRMLAGAEISVDYAYATALEGERAAAVVVGVADAQRAASAAGV